MRKLYEIEWSEKAGAARDAMTAERREKMERALDILANDPFIEPSRPVGEEDTDREVRLMDQIIAEYAVLRGRLLIFVLRIFDNRTLI